MARKITKTKLGTWTDTAIAALPVPPSGRRDYGYRLGHGVSMRWRVYQHGRRLAQVAIPDAVSGARKWADVGEFTATGDAEPSR
jgi:hypothetical protein